MARTEDSNSQDSVGQLGAARAARRSERRHSNRFITVCRIARVESPGDSGLWRVRNISDEGLMLAADVAMAIGDRLLIGLSDTIVLPGKIVWARDGNCGVAFAEKINAVATLRTLALEQRAQGYRPPRLSIAAEAVLALPGGGQRIDLVDISQNGAGFRYSAGLQPGTELDLILPGRELKRRALVRWSRGQRGGLWFSEPLARSDLESIARLGGSASEDGRGAAA